MRHGTLEQVESAIRNAFRWIGMSVYLERIVFY